MGALPVHKKGVRREGPDYRGGYQAARETALNCLAQLKKQPGSLDRIKQVLQVIGLINSAEGFMDQPAVLNGFTDLLTELWGDPGG